MKGKFLIIALLLCLSGIGQVRVPDNNLFYFSDIYSAVSAHTPATARYFSSCVTNSRDDYFDPRYKGSKDRVSCFRNYGPRFSITITSVTGVSCDAITVNATIVNPDNLTITSRGIVYSSSDATPGVPENAHANGSGTGDFSVTTRDVSPSVTYYVSAYALVNGQQEYSPVVTVTIPCACPNIGDSFRGGVVAYVYQPGDPGYVSGECHGIIASEADLSTAYKWSNNNNTVTTSRTLGSGATNTQNIINSQGVGLYAAMLCSNYSNAGYDDWYLPSLDELYKVMYAHAYIGNIEIDTGGNTGEYWSSTQYSSGTDAYFLSVDNLGLVAEGTLPKLNAQMNVRAIRYF